MAEEKAVHHKGTLPTVGGGSLSLVALGASIFSENDPTTTLLRGGAAFLGGYFVTQFWYLLTARTVVGVEEAEEEAVKEPEQPVEFTATASDPPPSEPVTAEQEAAA